MEFQRHHFGTGTKGLADGGRLHHAHHGVEGGLSSRHENVGNAFLTERRTSVGEIDEEVEGGGRFTVAVHSWPNPSVGSGHQIAGGVLTETCWGIARPAQSVVERHVAVHQRRIVDTVKRVRVRNNTTVSEAPKDNFPLWELFAFGSKEQVIVISGITLKDGPAHPLFIACGAEEERLRGEQLLGRPHVSVDDRLLLQVVREVGDSSFKLESVGVNPRRAQHQVGVQQFGGGWPDVPGACVSTGVVRCWNFFPRSSSRDVGHEGLGIELVVLCACDHGFYFVHQLDIRLAGQDTICFLE